MIHRTRTLLMHPADLWPRRLKPMPMLALDAARERALECAFEYALRRASSRLLALVFAATLAGCETAPRGGTTAGAGAMSGTAVAAGTAAQAHTRLIDAFNSCNEAAFVGAYAPLFTLATSNTKQLLTTREGLQRYLAAGCGTRPNPTAALVQQSTRVSGAITVLAGQYRFKVPVGAQPGQIAELLQNFTLVMERMGERWLVLAHHVSVAP